LRPERVDSEEIVNRPKKEAYRIVKAQLIVLLFFLVIACFGDALWGISLIVGGGIAWAPNLLLYRLLFKYFGAQYAKEFIRAFYLGQFFKFLLTVAGFTMVFAWTNWQPLPVILGFIGVQSVFWVALFLTKKRKCF
jgi:ATP synthase protein I